MCDEAEDPGRVEAQQRGVEEFFTQPRGQGHQTFPTDDAGEPDV